MNRPKIYFSTKLNQTQKEVFEENNIDFFTHESLQIKFLVFNKNLIDPKTNLVAFTSQNAVRALFHKKRDARSWLEHCKVYCVGEKTAALFNELFSLNSTVPSQQNAEHLAELIIEENLPQGVLFFCGTKRLGTLEEKLIQKEFDVQIVENYTTEVNRTCLVGEFDGLAFSSPSCVEAIENIEEYTSKPVFSMGKSTTEKLNSIGFTRINQLEKPSIDGLISNIAAYFKD